MARLSFVLVLGMLAASAAEVVQETATQQAAPAVQLDEAPESSVLSTLKEALLRQLRDPTGSGQEINAWVSLAVGVALVLDGEMILKWVVVGGAFILATLIAHNESAAFWGLSQGSPVRGFTGLEAGIASAFITFYCLDSVMLALGALFGYWIAQETKECLVAHGVEAFHTVPWLLFSWYSVIILGFWLLVATRRHVKFLGVVTPFLGGPLVASSISFFLTESATQGGVKGGHPIMGAWVDFLQLLLGTGDKGDVGVWANEGTGVHDWPVDRIFGCLVWLVCAVGGAFLQVKIKSVRAAKARELGAAELPLSSHSLQVE